MSGNADGSRRQGLVVDVFDDGPDVVVSVTGELDLATAPQLDRALGQVAKRSSRRVILDLRDMTFSDAAGLHVIGNASKELGNRLIVCGTTPPVRRVFEVTHLDDHLQLQPARHEPSDAPANILVYVRELLDAFSRGGPEQFAAPVPEDVEWCPVEGGGLGFRSIRELIDFWCRSSTRLPAMSAYAAVGDDVFVRCRFDGRDADVWSIYRFERRRLVRVVSYERQADALAALGAGTGA